MIELNRSDLDFLLRQVTINYLKPDANNPGQFIATNSFNYSALANALDPSGLREVAGSNNNLVGGYWDAAANGGQGAWVSGPYSSWGQSGQPFLNLSVGQPLASAPETNYNLPGGAVSDADPRLISNLVSTMFTSGSNANPAAAAVATNQDPTFAPDAQFGGLQFGEQDTAFVANAGVLGGGRYNGWFVAFGQFFDHGLDFVNRDANPNAKITVNLSPNDPLYSLGADKAIGGTGINADVTSIELRRADVANEGDAGGDGVFGTADDAFHSNGADGISNTSDDIYSKPQFINQTGLLIDQSQTYGSHQSVNALIREYDANGRPTGRVVSGHTGVLTDGDPNNDAQAQGLATWADIKLNALRIGVVLNDTTDLHNAPVLRVDPAGRLMYTPNLGETYTTAQIIGYNPAAQDPNDPFVRNSDGTVMRTGQDMLIDFNPAISVNDHIITGDGRGNENIGLTSVHHVFHEEHNAEVANIKASLLKEALLANDLTVLNGAAGDPSGGWSTTPIASFAAITGVNGLAGDAAAIATFFANQTLVDAALASISWNGERLYQAARLITESEYNHIAIDQYVGTLYGALPEFVSYSSDINPGVSLEFSQAVFRLGHSMLTETFNVTDPNTGQDLRLLDMFLNPTLYQDIGPTALAQGLTTTLGNEVDEFVTPALQQSLLGQPLDLATINIARGRDVNLPTWNEFRQQVYDQLIQNTNNTNGSALAPYSNWADVFDHLKNPLTGVNLIAAYARANGASADGLFGTPSDGDHDLTDAIVKARADYNAGSGSIDTIRDAAQALYDAYQNAADPHHAEALAFMEGAPQYTNGQWTFTGADQGFWDIDLWVGGLAERPLFDGPLGTTFSYVILDFAQRQQDGDRFYYLYRTPMGTHLGNEIIENQFGNLVMDATGLQHLNGEVFIWANKTFELTDNPDYFNAATQTVLDVDGTPIPASTGHIVIAGNGGDDFLVAGLGDDTVYGDAGNDQIYGSQGNDHLFGGDGDDYIFDDENDDFITGGAGNDRIFAGPGAIDTVFGDEGDDEIHGGDGVDELLGGAGDDLIYGDGDTDSMFGGEGNDYLEGGDSVDEMMGQEGNDWMRGGVGDDHLLGGEGNDLLEGGIGPTANDGDRLIGAGNTAFDNVAVAEPDDTGFDVASYEDVDIAITANLDTSNDNGTGGLLDTYAGIDGLVGSRFNDTLTGAGPDTISTNGFNNLLVGGGGNDTLTGLGGNDILVGDSVATRADFTVDAAYASVVTNWKGTGDDRPDYGLGALVDLGHFLGETGSAGTDTAVFRGNFADYDFESVTYGGYQAIRVTDARDPATANFDGTDILISVEKAQFADQTITLTPPALDLDAAFSGNVKDDFSPNGYGGNDGSVSWAGNWSESNDGFGGSLFGDITVSGNQLRFGSGTDGGETVSRSVNLSGMSTATLSFDYQTVALDTGEGITVQAWNGANWVGLGTLGGNASATFSASLTGALLNADSAIRFQALNNGFETGESVAIDNVNIAFSTPGTPGNNYSATFTEDGPATAIAALAAITDDSATMQSARIVLTNAKAGDVLNANAISGDGITVTTDTSVSGQIAINLTGVASKQAYLNQIEAITFLNTSQNPDTSDRLIHVTVNNGIFDSNIATATLHVAGVDDPLVASADSIVTNITGATAFVVPGWTLLANDGDPDSPGALSLTGLSGQSSLTATLNADQITITDTGSSAGTSNGSMGSFNYAVSNGSGSANGSVTVSRDTGTISTGAGNQILVGDNNGTTFDAGSGNDVILAGGGNDELNGGSGADTLVGGVGNDDFNFDDGDTGLGANADIIMDFRNGGGTDRIDLSAIDANATVSGGGGGGQTFTFIGTAAFSDSNPGATLAAGQVRSQLIDTNNDAVMDSTLVQGNVDNTLTADFEIVLKNYTAPLTASDFLL